MGREGFREDRPIEVGEFLDIPGLHLISGHHRVAAAFFSRWDELGGTVFPPSNEGSLRTEYFHDSSEQGWSLPRRVTVRGDSSDGGAPGRDG